MMNKKWFKAIKELDNSKYNCVMKINDELVLGHMESHGYTFAFGIDNKSNGYNSKILL